MRLGVGLLCVLLAASAVIGSNRYAPVGTFTAPCGQLDHMEGLFDVVVSPDDAFVYAAAFSDQSITIFARDAITGTLTPVGQHLQTDPGMSALGSPQNLAISPDGTTLYVSSGLADSVAAFARDPGDGSLSFVDVETDGVGGVSMDTPLETSVSPDGLHVYVAAVNDGAVVIFARDPGTGALTLLGTVENGVGGITGMDSPQRLAMSPDGTSLYVSSQGSFDFNLVAFTRSAVTGALTYVHTIATGGAAPVVSPDGAYVYASGSTLGPGFGVGINVLARNSVTGALTFTAFQPLINEPERLVMDPAGAHVYGSQFFANPRALDILARDAGTGALTPITHFEESNYAVDGLDWVSAMVFPSSGAQLYTAAVYDAAVGTFDRDAVTGLLTQAGLAFDSGPPLAAAASPGGEHVYVACARSVATLARDGTTGALSPVASRKHASIAGDDLEFLTGTDRPRITVAPNGGHVYFERGGAETDLGLIEVLARDGVTGVLSPAQALDADESTVSGAPSGIAVSPDDEHVYVSAAASRIAFAYDRDPVTGLLAFVEHEDSPSLIGRDVAVSPDGADVYVLGQEGFQGGETRIHVFARDPGSGALAQTLVVDQMPNYSTAASLALSADGANAYVSVDDGAAVSSLARDQVNGALSVTSTAKDGVGGATGLAGVQRVAVAPDGAHAFTVSFDPGSLGVFRRHDDTGDLSFVESHEDGEPGAEALGGARDLFVSPDSRFVYALARSDEGFTIFAPVPACTPTPNPTCQTASKGKLKIKTPGTDKKRVLVWKWQSTVVPQVGDPLATSDVALCVYDTSVGSQPRVDAVAPAGGSCGPKPCWQPVGAVLKYADKERTPDGLQTVKVVPKPGATSTVVMKARGVNVPTLSLPLTGPVTVQLQSSTGECVEATFTSATLNDATQFLAVL